MQKKKKKTMFKKIKKLITLDVDEIFDFEESIKICKSAK